MCVQRFYGNTLKTATQYIGTEVATVVHSCSCYINVRPKTLVATHSGKPCGGEEHNGLEGFASNVHPSTNRSLKSGTANRHLLIPPALKVIINGRQHSANQLPTSMLSMHDLCTFHVHIFLHIEGRVGDTSRGFRKNSVCCGCVTFCIIRRASWLMTCRHGCQYIIFHTTLLTFSLLSVCLSGSPVLSLIDFAQCMSFLPQVPYTRKKKRNKKKKIELSTFLSGWRIRSHSFWRHWRGARLGP